ncbi:hypothetical protein BABINDRAFT_182843 [Babjeviella inositovora NRRL Y-12698]|uniref:Uncharacterized protein n=1 Tax=Babjeviella inositovora NRRL Y-12698 TaxID=984486 RepID=A0A1E3QW68_9ASCO|nr:uncharacterized protein BABINDRAFT_182843 [Babjeviella inositovora NRRL Y-12698]ODQ81919.1 hypothetical protein BABINDRAFT_182843 [Babjeviella inositovora NRRL Y-12698]
MSNIIDDPSIITMGTGYASAESHADSSDALSRLLDSAIANASAESAIPLVPIELNAVEKLSVSPVTVKNPACVYPLELLLVLRESPLVPDLSPELPDADFWRFKGKSLVQQSPQPKREWASSVDRSDRNDRQNRRSRAKGRGQTHVRDEAPDLGDEEAEPEWDDVESSGHDMSKTVQDFEKWRAQMRIKERKQRGEDINEAEVLQHVEQTAAQAGSAVDSFFSFKSSASDVGEPTNSRFSSFFTPVMESNQLASPLSEAKDETSGEDSGPRPGSRFLAMTQRPSPSPQQSAETHEPPRANDSFFQSLMKKGKDEEAVSSPGTPRQSGLMALFNNGSSSSTPAPHSPVTLASRTPDQFPGIQQLPRSQQFVPAIQKVQGQNLPPIQAQKLPPGISQLPPGVQSQQLPGMPPAGQFPQGAQQLPGMPPGGQFPPGVQGQFPSGAQGQFPPGSQGQFPPGAQGQFPQGAHGQFPPGIPAQFRGQGRAQYPPQHQFRQVPSHLQGQSNPNQPLHLQGQPPYMPQMPMNSQLMGQALPQFRQGTNPNFPPGFMGQFQAPSGSPQQMPMNLAAGGYPPGYAPQYYPNGNQGPPGNRTR